MPLCLELAATWVKLLTCAEIARRMERSLDCLTVEGEAFPERQRSLRMVFEQAWYGLDEAERIALSCLAHQRGDFTLEAAEADILGESALVGSHAPLSLLSALVDKSMLQVARPGCYQHVRVFQPFLREQAELAPSE